MRELEANWWSDRYPQFMIKDIGSPCAPVSKVIARDVVEPLRFLEYMNAIGFHTLEPSQHCPAISTLERSAVKFSVKIVDPDAETDEWVGYVCSGATLANVQAVWMAAHQAKREKRKLVIRSTNAAHYSLGKAMQIAGIGKTAHCPLGEPRDRRERAHSLYLDWLTYGDTHTGTFEVPRGDRGNHLCHVDAAYGGLLCGMQELPKLDLANATSFVVDYHKTGRLPIARSVFCVRREMIGNDNFGSAYIPNGIDRTLEGSRSLAAVAQVAAYAERVGFKGHRDWVDATYRRTREVRCVFASRFGADALLSAGNVLLVGVDEWSPKVRACCYRFNVSRAWHCGVPANALRVFCWTEHKADVYLEFCDLLGAACCQ